MIIELHGFSEHEAEQFRGRITDRFRVFAPEKLYAGLLVNFVMSDVRDRHGDEAPFIRLYSLDASHFDLAIPVLRKVEDIGGTGFQCCLMSKRGEF